MKANRNRLRDFRNKKGLSQLMLGKKVARKMGLEWTDAVSQKRISSWESGASEPNDRERGALAEVLEVTREQIDENLSQTPQDSIFHWLARDGAEPSFVGICCTSEPREMHDQGTLSALQKGVAAQKISVALFIQGNAAADPRNGHTLEVELDVLRYYRCLTASTEDTRTFVKVYQPVTEVSMPFPPVNGCYYLVAYRDKGTIQSRLYLWVRTATLDELMLVDSRYTNITKVWQRYFSPIFTTWENERRLSDGGGLWKVFPECNLESR